MAQLDSNNRIFVTIKELQFKTNHEIHVNVEQILEKKFQKIQKLQQSWIKMKTL